MAENNTGPVDPVSPASTPAPKKRFNSGLVPGELHGSVRLSGVEPKEEPNVLAEVGKLTAAEFKRWKKDPANSKKLSEALAVRKAQS